jgi:LPS sulfotransferase NodH
VSVAREVEDAVDVRYERLSADPAGVAADLGERLGVDVAQLTARLSVAHGTSVGRFRTELTEEQLAAVEAEAGPLLREMGY